MKKEIHNICLWNNGLNQKSNLIDLINNIKDTDIKILSVSNYEMSKEELLKQIKND